MTLHGQMPCSRCWGDNKAVSQESGQFRLVRDPGHWGSSEPHTLVLGISKGNTQSMALSSGPFDAVAFKGIRHRILEIFNAVGLLQGETVPQFEARFTAAERSYAFASVVRCSLTGMDKKKMIHTADSPNVLRAFRQGSLGSRFVENCVDEHLVNLSPKTKLVLLLGNTDSYVKELRAMLARRRGPTIPINEISYWVNGVKFVHLAHPSKGNGHFGAYVRGEGTPGMKLRWAQKGLAATA